MNPFHFERVERSEAQRGHVVSVQTDGSFQLLLNPSRGGDQLTRSSGASWQRLKLAEDFPKLGDLVGGAILDELGSLLGDELARRIAEWEVQHRGESGLVAWDPARSAYADERLKNASWSTDRPVLLLLHGTFSSPEGAFEGLGPARLNDLAQRYDVVALRMHTIGTSPLTQAAQLLDLLPTDQPIAAISHSRGGIVGELIALPQKDAPEELKGKLGHHKMSHHIRVASPQVGTPFIGDNLDRWISVVLWLIDRTLTTAGPAAAAAWRFSKAALTAILASAKDPAKLPGLACMDPAGEVAALLRGASSQWTGRTIVAGNSGRHLFSATGLLARTVGELFFGGPSDLVVPVWSMKAGPRVAPPAQSIVDIGTAGIQHINYFDQPRIQALVSDPFQRPPSHDVRGSANRLNAGQRRPLVLIAAREARADAIFALMDALSVSFEVERVDITAVQTLDTDRSVVSVGGSDLARAVFARHPSTWMHVQTGADTPSDIAFTHTRSFEAGAEALPAAVACNPALWKDREDGSATLVSSSAGASASQNALGRVTVVHGTAGRDHDADAFTILPWFASTTPNAARGGEDWQRVLLEKISNDEETRSVGSTGQIVTPRGVVLSVGLGDPDGDFRAQARRGVFSAIRQAPATTRKLRVAVPPAFQLGRFGLAALLDMFIDAWTARPAGFIAELRFVTPWRDHAETCWHHLHRSSRGGNRFELTPTVQQRPPYHGVHPYVPPAPPVHPVRFVGTTLSYPTGPTEGTLSLQAVHGRVPAATDTDQLLDDPLGRLRDLVPAAAMDALDDPGLALVVDEHWTRVPWEALSTPSGPIGLRASVTRQLATPLPPDRRAPATERRALVIANPTGDLPGAAEEGRVVERLLRAAGYDVELVGGDTAEWGDAIRRKVFGAWRIVHIASHGDEAGRLLLGVAEDGQMASLVATDVEHMATPPSLVVLSCCNSGRLNLHSFAKGLLPRGTHAVVGTAWPIDDANAVTFAEAFYTELVRGTPIGVAARLARVQVAVAGGPRDWGSWQVWGESTFALRSTLRATDVIAISTPDELVEASATAIGLARSGDLPGAEAVLQRAEDTLATWGDWQPVEGPTTWRPRFTACWGALGIAWRFAGHRDRAIQCLEDAMEHAKDDSSKLPVRVVAHRLELAWHTALAQAEQHPEDRATHLQTAAARRADLRDLARLTQSDVARLADRLEAPDATKKPDRSRSLDGGLYEIAKGNAGDDRQAFVQKHADDPLTRERLEIAWWNAKIGGASPAASGVRRKRR